MSRRLSVSYLGTASAYLRMGIQATISYPMSFMLSQFGTALSILTLFFLNRIVRNGPIVADDYLGFVVIGIVGQSLVTSAMRGLGVELDAAIQQGRLEMLLIEPVRWPLIPVGLALWPMTIALWSAILTIGIGLGLGMRVLPAGILLALPLVLLGVLSGLSVAVIAASARLLAKRQDPIWLMYSMLQSLVCGITVPINVLPAPLRVISWLLPTTYVVSGLRKIMLPHSAAVYGPSGLWAIAILGIVLMPLGALAMTVFNRTVNVGRRLGVLAGY